jgi:hypothetical protein
MPAHSRSTNGVASLAYVAGIHVLIASAPKTWMAGTSPAMTIEGTTRERAKSFVRISHYSKFDSICDRVI